MYRKELPDFVRTITESKPVLTRGKSEHVTWQALADGIHANMKCDDEKKAWIAKGFGDCWRRFATDFLNSHFNGEYNALKHRLGGGLGGFVLSVGDEKIPGVPAKPEEMQVVGGSIFGTSYFAAGKRSAMGRSISDPGVIVGIGIQRICSTQS